MSETEAQYEKDRLARRVSGDGEPFQGRLFARFVRDEAACRCDAQIGRAWVYFSGDAGGELFAGVWGEDGAAGGDGAACEGASAGDERGGGVYDETGVPVCGGCEEGGVRWADGVAGDAGGDER